MERLKNMKESLMNCAQSQIHGNLAEVDAKELGEVIDMIKDLAEATYYCTITKAMEDNEKESKYQQPQMNYYTDRNRMMPDYSRDMDMYDGRMYYPGKMSYSNQDGSNQGQNQYNYTEKPMMIRDYREGRSPMSRKHYMEAKEMHKDKSEQMKELDNYMHELSNDITEMIQDATPEEKQILAQKIALLSQKIK